jgi:nucleoside-diphosphate-sugar epimerase
MKRRDFLQKTALVAAGGTTALGTCSRSEATNTDVVSHEAVTDDRPKTILVTSAHSDLARLLAAELSSDYHVRLTGPVDVQTEHEFVKIVLDHNDSTNSLVRGVDAIVHVAEPLLDADDTKRIDYRTRCTYNLLRAAGEEGVRHVVFVSSLHMMTGYDEGLTVDEDWRPLPTIASGGLSSYLGEFTCCEFAREGKVNVVVLRVGNVIRAGALAGEPFDPLCVDPRDVAQAVSRALSRLLAGGIPGRATWSVFHIQSSSSRARFSVRKAERVLGYQPKYGGPEP